MLFLSDSEFCPSLLQVQAAEMLGAHYPLSIPHSAAPAAPTMPGCQWVELEKQPAEPAGNSPSPCSSCCLGPPRTLLAPAWSRALLPFPSLALQRLAIARSLSFSRGAQLPPLPSPTSTGPTGSARPPRGCQLLSATPLGCNKCHPVRKQPFATLGKGRRQPRRPGPSQRREQRAFLPVIFMQVNTWPSRDQY